MNVWRWSSFAQAPATRLPWLSFILIIGTLLLVALWAIPRTEPSKVDKPQKDVDTLSETSLLGRRGPKR
jgi:hypothetical protein